jgi:Rrf2 family protein
MKLSSKSLYAVRALFNMAYHARPAPSKIEEIAQQEDVPPRFLEQIFQDLKKAGIVGSKRGPRGGYYLTRAPREVTLGEVIEIMEGPTRTSLCREDSADPDNNPIDKPSSLCVMAQVWEEVAAQIDEVLSKVTLQDLVERGEAQGLRREGSHEFIYVI